MSSPLKATPTACSARLPSPPSVLPAACCRPPITTAPVNTSGDVQDGAAPRPLRRFTSNRIRCWLGSSPPATSHQLVPSDSLRSSSALPLRVPRRAVRASLSPASALPLALVSALLLLPSPPSVCSTRPPSLPPHSPPLNRRGGSPRRVLRRRFPFACAPGFVVPDRLRGLWFSHPTHQ